MGGGLLNPEMALIGAAILGGQKSEAIANSLTPNQFYDPSHQIIWEAIREIVDSYAAPDFLALSETLGEKKLASVGGVEYLIQCADGLPSVSNWRFYARKVKEGYFCREIEKRAAEVAKNAKKGQIAEARAGILKIMDGLGDSAQTSYGAEEAVLSLRSHKMRGVETGLMCLDESADEFKGIPRGEVTLVAAPTGFGKTLLMIQMALHMCRNGQHVIFGTWELPYTLIVKRMIRMMCGYSSLENAEKYGNHVDVEDYHKAEAELAKFKLSFYDPGTDMSKPKTLEPFIDFVRYSHEVEPVDCFFGDYVQRMRLEQEPRDVFERVEEASLRCVGLANAIQCAGVIAAQIKVGPDGEAKLRGSLSVEDHVSVYLQKVKVKKKNEEPIMALRIEKSRYGSAPKYRTEIDKRTLIHREVELLK